jgi:hypothetical protein
MVDRIGIKKVVGFILAVSQQPWYQDDCPDNKSND